MWSWRAQKAQGVKYGSWARSRTPVTDSYIANTMWDTKTQITYHTSENIYFSSCQTAVAGLFAYSGFRTSCTVLWRFTVPFLDIKDSSTEVSRFKVVRVSAVRKEFSGTLLCWKIQHTFHGRKCTMGERIVFCPTLHRVRYGIILYLHKLEMSILYMQWWRKSNLTAQ